jgi:type VI secretion system protein ImpG
VEEALLEYYERELSVLRRLGQEFAQAYPKVAGRLLLEPGKCEDPHVERLIQAFALLAARIHHKIDDEFPAITDALLGILYPHYLAPVPSMSIVQFVLDPEQGKLTSGYTIPVGTQLYAKPIEGIQCRFRTCYPTTLWPIQMKSARFEPGDPSVTGSKSGSILRLELQCLPGMTFQELQLDKLRIYLDGESQLVHALYELLLNNSKEVRVSAGVGEGAKKASVLPLGSLQPVGFRVDEGLLAYPSHTFLGYRLLQEYFTFPQKFLFIDLQNLNRMERSGVGDRLEIMFILDRQPRADQVISSDTFKLGCTPIVNLFEQITEPIRLDQTQHEYMVIPDIRRPKANEVYAIQSVSL